MKLCNADLFFMISVDPSRNFLPHFRNHKTSFVKGFEARTYASYFRDWTLDAGFAGL